MGDAVWLPPIDPQTRNLTLVLGWRSGKGTAAARVSVAGDALETLREVCVAERGRLSDLSGPVEFEPGDDIALEVDEVGALPLGRVADPLGIRGHLEKPAALDLLPPAEIAKRNLLFYAVILDGESGRSTWIARANPARVLKRGFLLWDQRGSLANVETPVFVFEDQFDLVLTGDRLIVVSVGAFETFFEEMHISPEEAHERVTTAITAHLPVFGNGAEVLARAASQRVAYARLLEKIQEGDRLKDVTVAKVRSYARRQGIEPSRVVKGDALYVDEEDPGVLLRLLNEDLFRGGLTDTAWQAAAKRARDPK